MTFVIELDFVFDIELGNIAMTKMEPLSHSDTQGQTSEASVDRHDVSRFGQSRLQLLGVETLPMHDPFHCVSLQFFGA